MTSIAWSRLMRLGLVQMRLSPDVFWNLTPAELMLLAGTGDTASAMSRAGFEDLSDRFPDESRHCRQDME